MLGGEIVFVPPDCLTLAPAFENKRFRRQFPELLPLSFVVPVYPVFKDPRNVVASAANEVANSNSRLAKCLRDMEGRWRKFRSPGRELRKSSAE